MSTTDTPPSTFATTGDVLLKRRTDDGVPILTLNDPATRNALGPDLSDALVQTVHDFAGDRELRCNVLTGAGSAFCSGANVRGFKKRIDEAEKNKAQAAAAQSKPSARSGLWRTRARQSAHGAGNCSDAAQPAEAIDRRGERRRLRARLRRRARMRYTLPE